MKMRNGYVSNSSSSSFLVVYNSLVDFTPFRLFEKGYNRLMRDIPSSTDEDVIGFIESIIANYFYGLKEVYEKELYTNDNSGNARFDFSYNNQWNTFSCALHIPYDILNEKEIALELAADESMEALNIAYEKIENEGYRNEAEKIFGILKENFKMAAMEYEDHTDIGSYMEHDFMPFIKHNPDNKFAVFTQNNH